MRGKTIGIDATMLEANAALRSIVRREDGTGYEDFLKKHDYDDKSELDDEIKKQVQRGKARQRDGLAEQLLVRWPDLGVIVISGYTEDRTAELVRHLKSARFMRKPFTMAELSHEIHTALNEQ